MYSNIKKSLSLIKNGESSESNFLKNKYEQSIKEIQVENVLNVKDKEEMIELLQKELFGANEKVRNLQLIIDQNREIE